MKKIWVPFLFFVLSFYCFGAGIIDSFVIYHSWLYVGEKEFAAVHKAAAERVVLMFVLPTFILLVVTVLMFWHRPPIVPKHLLRIAFTSEIASWLSSAFIQIPIQLQLDQGKNDELIYKLIATDWIRIIAWLIYIIVVVQMMRLIIAGYLKAVNRNKIIGQST